MTIRTKNWDVETCRNNYYFRFLTLKFLIYRLPLDPNVQYVTLKIQHENMSQGILWMNWWVLFKVCPFFKRVLLKYVLLILNFPAHFLIGQKLNKSTRIYWKSMHSRAKKMCKIKKLNSLYDHSFQKETMNWSFFH